MLKELTSNWLTRLGFPMTVNSKGTPYIKPTRYKHDSGYRTFEVGYILEMNPNNTVKEKRVLGQHSDHIYTDYAQLYNGERPWSINMDLTMDGYIRFFSHQGKLKWDMDDWATSSMGLELYELRATPPTKGTDKEGKTL